jgi:uroporphyrinogen-III synthase
VSELLRGVVLAAIGPTTAKALTERGLPVDVMPHTYTVPALVAAVAAHLNRE